MRDLRQAKAMLAAAQNDLKALKGMIAVISSSNAVVGIGPLT